MIRFARIPLPVDIHPIQQEILKLSADWTPHLNTRHYTGNWDVIALRSPGGNNDNIIPDVMQPGQTFQNTSLMEQCPAIETFIASLECEIMSARLLNLKSGAFIKPHRDLELCFEKGEARLHVPVFTNSAVRFYCENDLIPMYEGECWYINANITHSVANNGDSDRIHLVIDCFVNEWLRSVFASAQKNETPDTTDTATTLAMIEALKTHKTETAAALIASLEAKLNAQQ